MLPITSNNLRANNPFIHDDLHVNHAFYSKQNQIKAAKVNQSLIKNDLSLTRCTDITQFNNNKDTSLNKNSIPNQPLSINQRHFSIMSNGKSAIQMLEEIKTKINKTNQIQANKMPQCLSFFDLLLQFFNGKDLAIIISSSKTIRLAIYDIIQRQAIQYIVTPFIQCYQSTLKVINKTIKFYIDKNTKGNIIFINYLLIELYAKLNIKVRITLYEKVHNSTIILENYSSWLADRNNIYRNIFKFDYRYKYSPSVYWVFKEQTVFNYDKLNKAYLMPILPFQCNDIGCLSINVISSLGLINFNSFQWKKLKYHPLKNEICYELNSKCKRKQIYYSRICEIEIAKTKWIQINRELPPQILREIENYNLILNKNFTIISIQWDNIGYIILKIKAKALTPGVIIKNTFIGIDISIIPREETLSNEIKKNGLIYDNENSLQIRVGDTILFYLGVSTST